MHIRHLLIAVVALFAAVGAAHAQTQLLTLEAGMREDSRLSGVRSNRPFIGLGGTGVLSGSAGKDGAVLAMLSFETRGGVGLWENGGFVDLALRRGPLTVGGGPAGRIDFSGAVADPVIGGRDGKVPVVYPIALGFSGFTKIVVSRLFVQVRYASFPPSMAQVYHTAEERAYAEAAGISLGDVTMKTSTTMRGAIGLTYDRVIIRAQAISEVWRFDRIFNNATGVYDRDGKVYSLGVSFLL